MLHVAANYDVYSHNTKTNSSGNFNGDNDNNINKIVINDDLARFPAHDEPAMTRCTSAATWRLLKNQP